MSYVWYNCFKKINGKLRYIYGMSHPDAKPAPRTCPRSNQNIRESLKVQRLLPEASGMSISPTAICTVTPVNSLRLCRAGRQRLRGGIAAAVFWEWRTVLFAPTTRPLGNVMGMESTSHEGQYLRHWWWRIRTWGKELGTFNPFLSS